MHIHLKNFQDLLTNLIVKIHLESSEDIEVDGHRSFEKDPSALTSYLHLSSKLHKMEKSPHGRPVKVTVASQAADQYSTVGLFSPEDSFNAPERDRTLTVSEVYTAVFTPEVSLQRLDPRYGLSLS